MKRFLLRTLLFLMPFIVALAYYLFLVDKEAMRGDLGRMSQNQFHYTMPQLDTLNVAPCRDVAMNMVMPLEDDEIVVFGDSFSSEDDRKWPNCRWHQFMGASIGKKIVMTGDYFRPVESYLTMLSHHPEYLGDTVIIETVERALVDRLCWLDFNNIADFDTVADDDTATTPLEKWNKQKRLPVQYYQRQVGIDVPVLTKKLDSPLFSCRPDKLYYFADDTITHTEWEINMAVANLQTLDSISKAHGITLFLVAIPDKYTAYHNYIKRSDKTKRLLEKTCPFDSIQNFINTLPAISEQIKKGVVDVYLPDDTHFSIPTARVIGEYVAQRLTLQP